MKTQQHRYSSGEWLPVRTQEGFDQDQCGLVLSFGAVHLIEDEGIRSDVRQLYPQARIVWCSTAGEIYENTVQDNSVVITAISFEATPVRTVITNINQHRNDEEAGGYIIRELSSEGLKAVFVLSDGMHVNGSDLVSGLNLYRDENLIVTGGLAGDGARFQRTVTGLDEEVGEGNVVAIGFYGDAIQIGHGSVGGWEEFGHEREITRSDQNILYELGGKNALALYKEYLGPYKDELPGSALLFPLSLKIDGASKPMVRTILSLSEEDQSMTFAGNMPIGAKVRLMKSSFEKLISASSEAAGNSLKAGDTAAPELGILISCVGRKLVLQERAEEEVESVSEKFGPSTAITGFYSYGEISPFAPFSACDLQNQTMTITTFSETISPL